MSRGKSNTKNWKKNDRAYREQQAARARANRIRRAEVAEAAARGIPVDQYRVEKAAGADS
jgi:hypothetical protein